MMKETNMYILDVIPTIKIPKIDLQVLSYFSSASLTPGALVRVPVGRQQLNAVVLGAQPLGEQKFALKKSSYQIKNIAKVLSEEPVLNARQIALLQYCADYYMSPLPIFLKTFLPNYLIAKKTSVALAAQPNSAAPSQTPAKPLLIMQEDRITSYHRLIQETIASGRQILVLAPEIAIARFWMEQLEEYNPLLLTSELTPKTFFTAWNRIRMNETQCIVGTRAAVFANFSNLGLIIIDEEQNPHYKSWDMLPYYHTRTVALELARLHGARVVMGSATPSVATYWHAHNSTLESSTPQYELSQKEHDEKGKPHITVVDMRNELLDKNYSVFSYQLKNALEELLASPDKKALLFIARRGSASFYFCADCKHIATCKHCDAHTVYHKTQGLLVCHLCGFKATLQLCCSKCKGTRMRMFGAGTHKVAEEVEKLFGYADCLIMDADTAKTHREQEHVIKQFQSGTSRVLIATQSVLNKPTMPSVDLIGVVSLDNMLYIPDYAIGERLYQTIAGLLKYSSPETSFFVQSNTPENEALRRILAQDYEAFYAHEIEGREQLNYPPFSTIIKIIVKNKSEADARRHADALASWCADTAVATASKIEVLGPASAYVPKLKNQYFYQIILKIIDAKHDFRERVAGIASDTTALDVDPEHLI